MSCNETKTIKVSNGLVQGLVINSNNRKIVQFLSIPFCKPPINELRFQKPQRHKIFTDAIINKLQFETCFPQLPLQIFNGENPDEDTWIPKQTQNEDSLYVNIWCPLDILEGNKLEPVFVWIFGGGFVSGSSSLDIYNGSMLSSKENVIVVSFNYRVGMLGFICLDENLVNGNLGLWDQVEALHWIQDNISAFNGDRNNVTIGGNSAGGCSVSLHMLMEQSSNCFHRVLISSGVCYSSWAFLPRQELVRRSIVGVNKILDKYNHPVKWDDNLPTQTKLSIISFLQTLDHKEFLIDKQLVQGMTQFAWAPCADGELIKDCPRHLFKSGQFKKCPSIFLNVENEGSYFVLFRFPNLIKNDVGMIDVKYFNDSFQFYPHYPVVCPEMVRKNIRAEYGIQNDELSITTLDQIIGEQYFVCDSIELANDISRTNTEVYYLWFKVWVGNESWPSWCGVMHSEDIYYLFGYGINEASSDLVKETSRILMQKLGKFIRAEKMEDEGFDHYDETLKRYMSIENGGWNVKEFSNDLSNKTDFWSHLRLKNKIMD